jgi:hypothetical protein
MKDSWKCGGGRVEENDGIECSSGVRRGIKGSGVKRQIETLVDNHRQRKEEGAL